MEKRQLRIDVLGTSFVIQSDESAEHLSRLSAYVKSRYSFADPLTVAMLAALNIADELFKTRDGRAAPGSAEEIEGMAERLISRMDDALLSHTPWGEDPPQGYPPVRVPGRCGSRPRPSPRPDPALVRLRWLPYPSCPV